MSGADPAPPKFTAKDFILEELVKLREANPEDRQAMRDEIRGLTAYLIVAEMEHLADAVTRSMERLTELAERISE